MANSIEQNGALTATIIVPSVEGTSGTAGAATWAQLNRGGLKDLLTAPYANFAEFFAAYATAGVVTAVLAADGSAPEGSWGVVDGSPVFGLSVPVDLDYQVCIAARHSIDA